MPIRTFVAIPVPETWETYLTALARDLARVVQPVSWTRPGNFHMTVRFLGDLGEDGASRVGDAVARGAEGAHAVDAEMGGIGAFPSLDRPRVIWVGAGRGEAVFAGDGVRQVV